jgi:type IV secretory pathway VirB10-like protein
MEPKAEENRTEIIEEQEAAPKKPGKRKWILIGFGAGALVIALIGLFIVSRKPQQQTPSRTAEEMEQLKYDSEQHDREKQKADQLRDQSYLVRKENDNQAQLNSLMKDFDMRTNSLSGLSTPIPERQAKAEEEAIAHVLRSSGPARVQPESTYQAPRRAAPSSQATTAIDGSTNPMFVYSRSFGGAKYVDAPRKQAAAVDNGSVASAKLTPGKEDSASEKPEEKAQLLYTDFPPVTLYEGEMLDAVLVNRIIADTEPSPVICQLSKDVFDHTARYVVLPAGSRIVGVSQVVTYKGAHRLFISFQRIILPNGPSIDLPANRKMKALDETGALGVVSKVERHWFLQFGTAIFFGVLDGLSGAAQKSQDAYSTRSIILGSTSENYDRVLENIMSQYSSIVPTIRVDQGKTMKIYLSDDLLITPYAKISDRSYYANH